MQPLNLLNNVQKARLLHSLMINEIPAFVGYLDQTAKTVLNDRDRIAEEWKDQLFSVEMWFELASEVQKTITRYRKDLYKSSHIFAEQLFSGYMSMFSVHSLLQYTASQQNADPKFRSAVELLFG